MTSKIKKAFEKKRKEVFKFHLGDRVIHKEHGIGIITKCDSYLHITSYFIDFRDNYNRWVNQKQLSVYDYQDFLDKINDRMT